MFFISFNPTIQKRKKTFVLESQHGNKCSCFPYYFPMRNVFSTLFQ